jgi:hypothetical protein
MYCHLQSEFSQIITYIYTNTEYQTVKNMPILRGNATSASRTQEKMRNGIDHTVKNLIHFSAHIIFLE